MTLALTYLARNVTRNPLRTALTCVAVGLPVSIYVLAFSVVAGLESFLDNSARQLRIAVTNKASIVNPLPAGYRAKIESLDPTRERLVAVCGMAFIGGTFADNPRPLSTLAADHDTFLTTMPEYKLAPDERDAWIRDRQAIVVGRGNAGYFGWKKGDRITITPSLPPYAPMEFHVVSTGEHAPDPTTNWCRRDYLDEELDRLGFRPGWISFMFVKCDTKDDLDEFRVRIEQQFANSPDQVLAQDEKSFMNQFIQQQFDLPNTMRILSAVTIFVAVLAAANTMSMNFRDRLGEYATLKSLGFGGRFVFGLVQGESLALCALGGLLGAALPFVMFTFTPLKDYDVPLIQHLDIPLSVCARALAISGVVGVLAALAPAWLALRLHVVTALRRLG